MKKAKETYRFQKGCEMPSTCENQLRVHFYRIKDDIRENKATTLYAEDEDELPLLFKLTWDDSHGAWKSAFRHTMALITKQLKELKKRQKDYDVAKVIVSGGSSRHNIIRGFIENECRALGMAQPFYMTRISRDYE